MPVHNPALGYDRLCTDKYFVRDFILNYKATHTIRRQFGGKNQASWENSELVVEHAGCSGAISLLPATAKVNVIIPCDSEKALLKIYTHLEIIQLFRIDVLCSILFGFGGNKPKSGCSPLDVRRVRIVLYRASRRRAMTSLRHQLGVAPTHKALVYH